jgi:hypothetical protein
MYDINQNLNLKCLLREDRFAISAAEICEVMDTNGMTNIGFVEAYKTFQDSIKDHGSGLQVRCLLKPRHVTML